MFDLSQISAYLVPSIVILCLCVGYIVKNLIPGEEVNRFIPLIVAIVGLVAGIFSAATAGLPITVDVIVSSVVSGISSSGFYEMFKNFIESGKGEIPQKTYNVDDK